MPDAKSKSFLERLCSHFYDNEEELRHVFSEAEAVRILRLRDLDREVMRNPMDTDYNRVHWLMNKYHIKERQAYYDLADLRVAVGSVSSFSKEYARRELSEGLKRMMRTADEKKAPDSYARLAKIYNAINRLDKDDPEPIDHNLMPLSARPTTDASHMDESLTPDKMKELKKEIESRWGKRLVEDVDYEEMPEPLKDPFEISKMQIERKVKHEDDDSCGE